MAQKVHKISQRQQEWNNDPKVIAFRHRLARAGQFVDLITDENMTEALVGRLAAEIDALGTDEILHSRYGHEEFMPEINHLGDMLALLDHEIVQKRRNKNA